MNWHKPSVVRWLQQSVWRSVALTPCAEVESSLVSPTQETPSRRWERVTVGSLAAAALLVSAPSRPVGRVAQNPVREKVNSWHRWSRGCLCSESWYFCWHMLLLVASQCWNVCWLLNSDVQGGSWVVRQRYKCLNLIVILPIMAYLPIN